MSDFADRVAALPPEKRILLERRLKSKSRESSPAQIISRQQDGDTYPLSFAQERLWFLDQLQPGSSIYNLYTAVRIPGLLNVVALERSLNEIVQRHETLRTTFVSVAGEASSPRA